LANPLCQQQELLHERLRNESLSDGSVELYLRCNKLDALRWIHVPNPFGNVHSLLRIDLSGLPKLGNIPEYAFTGCIYLESAVFGADSNITNIGGWAFQHTALTRITLPNNLKLIEAGAFHSCSGLERVVFNKNLIAIDEAAFQYCVALKSISLPKKLKTVGPIAFASCNSLKRVVCNKNLRTIGESAFQSCSKLEDVQLASSSINFIRSPFAGGDFTGCDRLIEIADAAGFLSSMKATDDYNKGRGIVPSLINQFNRKEWRTAVLVAHMRFVAVVHTNEGSEKEKVAAAKKELYPRRSKDTILVGELMQCFVLGGGARGVLSTILSYV